MTTTRQQYACPRCGDPLSPIYVLDEGGRRAIALACREQYCDHFQRLPEPLPNRAQVLRGLPADAKDKRSA